MRKLFVLSVLASVVVLYACKHEVLNPGGSTGTGGNGGTGTGGTNTDIVCFEKDILPIFQTSCARNNEACHSATHKQDGYVLDSYQNIMKKGIVPGKPNQSDIYESITETRADKWMPRNSPKLLQSQIDLIKKWIEQGAQNTTNCGTACDTAVFTFSGAVKPILDRQCISCHTGATGYNGVDLSTWAGVKASVENGKLMPSILHTGPFKMPKTVPDGQRKLTECEIKQIQKWIAAGKQNN